MCFSASASFGASAVLVAAGTIALKKIHNPSQRLFASIPLIFATQQFFEGLVWLSLMHQSFVEWQQIMVHIFIFFAYAVWPVWVPMTIMLLEKNTRRKKILKGLLAAGILVSLYIAYCVIFYPITVSINDGHHIHYAFGIPPVLLHVMWVSDGLYFMATLLAPFITTTKKMWLFGVVLCASYVISRIFFKDAIISVWCYFAAVLSVVVWYIVKKPRNATTLLARAV